MKALIAAVVLVLGLPALAQETKPPEPGRESLAIPYEKYTLKSGLEVILSVDRKLPIVAVNLWYHVGAYHEVPGRTGFAHLFEHMMFQGSKNVPDDVHFSLLEKIGATDFNGTTSFDRTNYFETVPSNHLETALWLERVGSHGTSPSPLWECRAGQSYGNGARPGWIALARCSERRVRFPPPPR